MTHLLFVGIAVLDQVFRVEMLPAAAVKYRARDLTVIGGGLAANAAVAATQLGGKASLITRLGNDLAAAEIMASLEGNGVDCAMVRRFDGCRSPLSAVFVDTEGERMIVNYADPAIADDTGWLPKSLPDGVAGVMGDIRWENGAAHIFSLARAAGVPAVLDVDRKPADGNVVEAATHVALSSQALQEMTGTDDPAGGLATLSTRQDSWLAVTVGSRGTWFIENGEIAHEPAFEVEVVDTLAAGDVWHGALTLALAEGMKERQAVRFASAAAAIKCMCFGGGSGTPGRAEVEAFLAERGGR